MSTRAEMAKYEEERKGPKKAKKAKRPKGRHSEAKRAAKKATVAKEAPSKSGKRSRKSTRGSANRMKADATYNINEENRGRSPDREHDVSRAVFPAYYASEGCRRRAGSARRAEAEMPAA